MHHLTRRSKPPNYCMNPGSRYHYLTPPSSKWVTISRAQSVRFEMRTASLSHSLWIRRIFVPRMRSTTILAVRKDGKSAMGGDGQVTLGAVVMKADAHKIRRLHNGQVLVGFAGAAADAFALIERFEAKLKDFQGSVPRAATELAKEWRTDRALRRLEAMM